jgi:hypothetical protein
MNTLNYLQEEKRKNRNSKNLNLLDEELLV